MKILYFSDNYTWDNWGTKRSIYEEVKLRGHNITWIDKSQLKSKDAVGNHQIFQLCFEHNPEQIWLSHSNLQLPIEVKKALKIPVVGFGFSDPYYFCEDRFTSYDAYITNHYETFLKYQNSFLLHYNPTACDRNYHKKMDIEQDIDVSIIGRGEHLRFEDRFARIKIAEMLRDHGIHIAAFGDGWPEHPDNHGAISGDTFREIICRSKIGLDVQETFSPLAHRMLEYGACGIPVITRRRPEVFRLFDEDEIITYSSEQELVGIVKRYLTNESERTALAEKLYTRCRESHDISNRVDGILEFIERVFHKRPVQSRPLPQQTRPTTVPAAQSKRQMNIAKGIGNVTIGHHCAISERAYIGYQEHGGNINIGDDVQIEQGTILRTCTGNINIGDRVSIGYNCIFHGQGGISLGNDVVINPGASIYAQNHGTRRDKKIREQENTYLGIKIRDDVWIGPNAIILDGVTVGTGAVIGAGAVVTRNIPDYEIWSGNPAVKVGERRIDYFLRAQQEVELGNMISAQEYIRKYRRQMQYDQLNPIFSGSRKSNPLFSVIVVTCNRPKDVRLCIDSLRQEEFSDYEVIVADNGNAEQKADFLAGQVDVYVNCPINFNPSEGRNIAAYFARGQILVFLDDDAFVGPAYLKSIRNAFEQFEILGLRGKIVPKNNTVESIPGLYDLGEKPICSFTVIEGNTAFRRDAYLAVGGMDPLLYGHEGFDISYRLMQQFQQPSALIYWPQTIIYHDYGDPGKFNQKRQRYERNREYIKYKYNSDVIGLKDQVSQNPLKKNLTGQLLPPLPPLHQPVKVQPEGRIQTSNGPKVSIVMSCHNAAQFLAETMESILTQTFIEWELLVTDDGSTDETKSLLMDYANMDSRIRVWFFDEQKGPYVRRNYAIQQAKAPFISIQDADDLMAPDKLKILYEEICRDPQLGIVGSHYRRFLDVFRGEDFGDRMQKRLTHQELMEVFPRTWHLCWHGSAIIRKSLFDAIGLYDEQPYGSDTFWLAKAGLYGLLTDRVKFKNLPEFLTCKREHALSQTGRISPADPRSRRHRLEQYYLQKLQHIKTQVQADPSLDLAQQLRECTCTDFIPKFGDLFEQWESAPLDKTMIRGMINRGLAEFSSEHYVSALITLNYLIQMVSKTNQAFNNIYFTCALAYYACGDDQRALETIQKEIQLFCNQNAQSFLDRYIQPAADNSVSAAERRKHIRQFIDQTSKSRLISSSSDFQQQQSLQAFGDSDDFREKLKLAKQFLSQGKPQQAAQLYRDVLSDNMVNQHIALKEKLNRLVEIIDSQMINGTSSQKESDPVSFCKN